MLWIFLIVFLAGFIFLLVLLRRAGGGNFPWIQFYIKGKESGFNFREINLLRRVAVDNRLLNPLSLFWSIKTLDNSIKGMIVKFRSENKMEVENSVLFLSKLFRFRKRVELDLPKYKLGLKTSRKIEPRQRIKISLSGVGTFTSVVVENLRRYIAISYPQGPKLPPGYSWRGQRVSVYFWRSHDAGYVFETKILEDFQKKKYPILHLTHSDSLIRSQKRKSVRVETNLPAFLYPLNSIENANELLEESSGLRCRIVDLSEDGAAVLIGGKAKVGLPIKLQFKLIDTRLPMCGVVKGVVFNQKKNQSILHLQAAPLSPWVRNRILIYVYNIFQEREELVKTPAKK